MSNGVAVVEIARVDGSMSTFLLVHSYLAMLTIGLLVSDLEDAGGPGLQRNGWAATPRKSPVKGVAVSYMLHRATYSVVPYVV